MHYTENDIESHGPGTSRPLRLLPYPYQVSGCSLVMLYNKDTIIKPLMSREYDFYLSMPDALKAFAPQYKGVTEVFIDKDSCGNPLCYCMSNNVYPSRELLSKDKEQEKMTLQDLVYCMQNSKMTSSFCTSPETNNQPVKENSNSEHFIPGGRRPSPIALNPWISEVQQRLRKEVDCTDQATKTFIVLENITAKFKRPCILDLKMGTRQHHDGASQEKVDLSIRRIASSTSSTLGSRLCGMQIYDAKEKKYTFIDKFKGRMMSQEEFENTLKFFFLSTCKFRVEILKHCISRISALIACLKTVKNYRFYSSSLLIIYDACSEEPVVDLRIIDFANITVVHNDSELIEHDKGIVFGLNNINRLLHRFLKEFSDEIGQHLDTGNCV